jgi:hypothetical protein
MVSWEDESHPCRPGPSPRGGISNRVGSTGGGRHPPPHRGAGGLLWESTRCRTAGRSWRAGRRTASWYHGDLDIGMTPRRRKGPSSGQRSMGRAPRRGWRSRHVTASERMSCERICRASSGSGGAGCPVLESELSGVPEYGLAVAGESDAVRTS